MLWLFMKDSKVPSFVFVQWGKVVVSCWRFCGLVFRCKDIVVELLFDRRFPKFVATQKAGFVGILHQFCHVIFSGWLRMFLSHSVACAWFSTGSSYTSSDGYVTPGGGPLRRTSSCIPSLGSFTWVSCWPGYVIPLNCVLPPMDSYLIAFCYIWADSNQILITKVFLPASYNVASFCQILTRKQIFSASFWQDTFFSSFWLSLLVWQFELYIKLKGQVVAPAIVQNCWKNPLQWRFCWRHLLLWGSCPPTSSHCRKLWFLPSRGPGSVRLKTFWDLSYMLRQYNLVLE